MPPVCVPPFRLNIKTNKCKKPCKRTEATNPRTKRCVSRGFLKRKFPDLYGENFDFDNSESRFYERRVHFEDPRAPRPSSDMDIEAPRRPVPRAPAAPSRRPVPRAPRRPVPPSDMDIEVSGVAPVPSRRPVPRAPRPPSIEVSDDYASDFESDSEDNMDIDYASDFESDSEDEAPRAPRRRPVPPSDLDIEVSGVAPVQEAPSRRPVPRAPRPPSIEVSYDSDSDFESDSEDAPVYAAPSRSVPAPVPPSDLDSYDSDFESDSEDPPPAGVPVQETPGQVTIDMEVDDPAGRELEIYREKYGILQPVEYVRVRTNADLETWGNIQDIMVKFLNGQNLKELLRNEGHAVVETVLRTFNITDLDRFDEDKVMEDVGNSLDAITSKLGKTETYKKYKSFDSLYMHSDRFFKPFNDYVDMIWPSYMPERSDFVVVFAKSIKESTASSWEVAFRLAEKIKDPMLDRGIQQALRASATNVEDFRLVSRQALSDWKRFFDQKLTPFSISALHNLIKLRLPVETDTPVVSDLRSKLRDQTDPLQDKLASLYRSISTDPVEPTVRVIDREVVASHPMEDIGSVHRFLEKYFEGVPVSRARLTPATTIASIPEEHDVHHYYQVHEALKRRLNGTDERILMNGCKNVQTRSRQLLDASREDEKLIGLGAFLRSQRMQYLSQLQRHVSKISEVSDILKLFEKHQSEQRENIPAFTDLYEKAKSRFEVLHKVGVLMEHQALKEAIVHKSLTKRENSVEQSFYLIDTVSVNEITIDLKAHLPNPATFESFTEFSKEYCEVTSQNLSEINFPPAVTIARRTNSNPDVQSELNDVLLARQSPPPPPPPPLPVAAGAAPAVPAPKTPEVGFMAELQRRLKSRLAN